MESEPPTNPTAEANPVQQDDNQDDHSGPTQTDPATVNAGRRKFCYRDQISDKDGRRTRLVKSAQKQSLSKRFSNVVILIRRVYTERMQYSHTEYDVRDRTLRNLLSEIHRDTKGIEVTDSHIQVAIEILYWAIPKLSQRMQELADPQSVEDHKELFAIGAAIELVLEECSSTIASLAETLPRNKIRWETLWMILPPNVHVYTKDAFGQDRVYLVRRHHQIRKQDGSVLLQMETEHVDSDGSKLGIVQDVIELPQFGGVSAINDLPIYPLEYHPRVIELRLELLERGKKQLVYHGPGPKGPHHITEHKGFGLKPGSRRLEKFNTHGRLVIDAAAIKEIYPEMDLVPELADFRTRHGRAMTRDLSDIDSRREAVPASTPLIDHRRVAYNPADDDSESEDGGHPAYSADDLPASLIILLSGVVYGYSLGDCMWGIFAVTNLNTVQWNKALFDSLVMSEKQKNLISQLIKSHGYQDSGFDDFVKDKGRGLVGLLLGSPGLGKTLTAEAIAETAKMPLFTMSSGSLGQTATKINQNLKVFLELATRWKSVLLLDEADVFLAKRSTSDLERNSIVSVFLRELEYYPGILILTTNRAHTIDEAFQSRIHFVYCYPNHDFAARRKIWGNFIDLARKNPKIRVDMGEEGIDRLAELPFNGRQIKNAMSIAVELAAFDRENNHMSAQNIIDASLCLQNFDSMNQPDQKAISATLSDHPGGEAKEEKSSELGVVVVEDAPKVQDVGKSGRVLDDSTPASSSVSAPGLTRLIVPIPPETAKGPSGSGRKKPRKLMPKSQSTEKES